MGGMENNDLRPSEDASVLVIAGQHMGFRVPHPGDDWVRLAVPAGELQTTVTYQIRDVLFMDKGSGRATVVWVAYPYADRRGPHEMLAQFLLGIGVGIQLIDKESE